VYISSLPRNALSNNANRGVLHVHSNTERPGPPRREALPLLALGFKQQYRDDHDKYDNDGSYPHDGGDKSVSAKRADAQVQCNFLLAGGAGFHSRQSILSASRVSINSAVPWPSRFTSCASLHRYENPSRLSIAGAVLGSARIPAGTGNRSLQPQRSRENTVLPRG
jgi:hypothetical protein